MCMRAANLMSDNTNNVGKLRWLPNEQKAAQLIVAVPLLADVIVTLINLNNVDITGEEQLARFAYNSDNFLIVHHVKITLCKRHLTFFCNTWSASNLSRFLSTADRIYKSILFYEDIEARLIFKIDN